MKKTKLLTSVVALTLVVGLGACGEKKTITIISDSSTEVLKAITDRGATIDSWTGIDGLWETHYDYYFDMSSYGMDSNWYDEYDSFYYTDVEKAVVKDDVLTGLWEETVYEYDGDTVIGEYVEGDDYWLNYYGYVIPMSAADAGVTGLEYFTEDLVYLIEDEEEGLVASFASLDDVISGGNPYYTGFSISGTLEESSLGPQSAHVLIEYDYSGYYTGYGEYTDSGFMDLAIHYDAEGQITSFAYTYDDTVVWAYGETDCLTQTITYAPFDGEIERPNWVTSD